MIEGAETAAPQESGLSDALLAFVALGSKVSCDGEPVGVVADLILEPVEPRLTHIVVEHRGHHELGRLVPLDLVELRPGDSRALELRSPASELKRFPAIQSIHCLSFGDPLVGAPDWNVGVVRAIAQPGLGDLDDDLGFDQDVFVAYDRIPRDTVELQRGSVVRTSDGHRVGKVRGVRVGPTGLVAGLRIGIGYLWRRRELHVDLEAVQRIRTDEVDLTFSRDELLHVEGRRVRPRPTSWKGALSRLVPPAASPGASS